MQLMGKILVFPPKSTEKPKKLGRLKGLKAEDVQLIGFLTEDNRDLWIDNPADIERIINFIIKKHIIISEE